MRTYQGKAIFERVVNDPLIPGRKGMSCLANTTIDITTSATDMPRMASRWIALRHSQPRKKPPSSAPYVNDAIDKAITTTGVPCSLYSRAPAVSTTPHARALSFPKRSVAASFGCFLNNGM